MKPVAGALALLMGCGFEIGGSSAPVDAESDATAGDDAGLDPIDASVDAPIDSPPAPVERVTTGIVALYTFEEAAGVMVMDRSGVGTPVNLVIANASNVQWSTGTLTMTAATQIMSAGAATKMVNRCRDADAVTLEAWVIPRAIDASVIGRVATLSSSNSSLAVSLMALGTHYELRLDGPMTDANGLPSLDTPNDAIVLDTLRHVVMVTAPGGDRRLYLDGVQVASDTLGGDLSAWGNAGHRFGVGNEIDGGRPFLATFDLVAMYARALSSAEVQQNFAAGPR